MGWGLFVGGDKIRGGGWGGLANLKPKEKAYSGSSS